MATDKDWKTKYKAVALEIEDKESQWQELDTLLRKTISRVSIAGRGFDKRLDEQLKLIQNLARDKKDNKLSDALDKLSRVVATLDEAPVASPPPETTATQEAPKPAADPSALLLALLQEIQFKEDQRTELKSICGELLKLLGSDEGQTTVKPQILKLSALINDNFGRIEPPPAKSPQAGSKKPETSINEVLTTLLEKLTVIQGAGNSTQLLQVEALDKIEDSAGPRL